MIKGPPTATGNKRLAARHQQKRKGQEKLTITTQRERKIYQKLPSWEQRTPDGGKFLYPLFACIRELLFAEFPNSSRLAFCRRSIFVASTKENHGKLLPRPNHESSHCHGLPSESFSKTAIPTYRSSPTRTWAKQSRISLARPTTTCKEPLEFID